MSAGKQKLPSIEMGTKSSAQWIYSASLIKDKRPSHDVNKLYNKALQNSQVDKQVRKQFLHAVKDITVDSNDSSQSVAASNYPYSNANVPPSDDLNSLDGNSLASMNESVFSSYSTAYNPKKAKTMNILYKVGKAIIKNRVEIARGEDLYLSVTESSEYFLNKVKVRLTPAEIHELANRFSSKSINVGSLDMVAVLGQAKSTYDKLSRRDFMNKQLKDERAHWMETKLLQSRKHKMLMKKKPTRVLSALSEVKRKIAEVQAELKSYHSAMTKPTMKSKKKIPPILPASSSSSPGVVPIEEEAESPVREASASQIDLTVTFSAMTLEPTGAESIGQPIAVDRQSEEMIESKVDEGGEYSHFGWEEYEDEQDALDGVITFYSNMCPSKETYVKFAYEDY